MLFLRYTHLSLAYSVGKGILTFSKSISPYNFDYWLTLKVQARGVTDQRLGGNNQNIFHSFLPCSCRLMGSIKCFSSWVGPGNFNILTGPLMLPRPVFKDPSLTVIQIYTQVGFPVFAREDLIDLRESSVTLSISCYQE